MRKFYLLLVLIVSQVAFGQKKDSLNVMDADGMRQGKWVITNRLMKPSLTGYADDQKVEEGRYKDGKKVGVWVAYYANGIVKNRITFVDGRPFGQAIMYHENGKIAEQGEWKNNRWVGDYKLFYDNGEVQHQFHFNTNGKREGKQVYFAENGQKIIEGEMHEGKEIGNWSEWYDNGDKRADKVFNNGSMDTTKSVFLQPKKQIDSKPVVVAKVEKEAPKSTVVDVKNEVANGTASAGNKPVPVFKGEGYYKLYRLDRQISKDGEFHNFKLYSGKSFIYNTNGILERIAVYQNGVYVGDAPLPVE